MRLWLAAIVFHHIGSTAQQLGVQDQSPEEPNYCGLTASELHSTLIGNDRINHADSPKALVPIPSFSPFSHMMVDEYVDTPAICAEYNGKDEQKVRWHYTWVRAECDEESGNPRRFKVTCFAEFTLPRCRSSTVYGERTFPRQCPPNKICRRTTYIHEGDAGPRTDIMCSDTNQIRVEEVSASSSRPHGAEQDVHCGLSLALPGSQYRAAPSGHQYDLIMTEEVLYPNGSAYPAPVLFIRDKTSRYGYDRVLREHASVASTSVMFQSVRGKIQPRTYQFCMRMMPGRPHSWVTFIYAWTLVAHRRGRVHSLEGSNTAV